MSGGGFFDAVSLLTRFPTRSGANRARALPWIPLVGALIGGLVAVVYVLTRTVLGHLVAALLAVGAGVVATGALHEDGLADTADAFGAGVDAEGTREILKDPRHGTYGVLALIGSVAIRVGALATLGPWSAAAVLPAAHALSRAGTLGMMATMPAADSSVLGSSYKGTGSRAPAAAGVITAAVLTVAAFGWWSIAALALVGAVVVVIGLLSRRKIGGFTGDVLGAVEQLSEVGLLLLASAAGHAIPWWHR
jgi:adenosylcobinamide-GDP ribazoletransferase